MMTVIEAILDQIGHCLFELNRGWFHSAVTKAADDFLREIKPGDQHVELYAAGLIFAISRHNSLDNEDSVKCITADSLGRYFQIDCDRILKKAGEIAKTLELEKHKEKYTDFDLSYIFEEFELDEDQNEEEWVSVELILKHPHKINKSRKKQFKSIVQELLSLMHEHWPENYSLYLIKVTSKGKKLKVRMEGKLDDLNIFCDLLREMDLTYDRMRFLTTDPNRFEPEEGYAMFMEQYELMNLDDREFNSIDELQHELERFHEKTTEENRKERPMSPNSQALIDSINAFNLPRNVSIKTINQILQQFPDCAEALICLAGWQKNVNKRIQYLESALQAGERSLDIEAIDRNKTWWGDHHTRPYMRAMRLMALELLNSEKIQEGMDLLWELLEMNEADNQGNREILMEFCITQRHWIDVRKLLKKYAGDDFLVFVYGEVIYLYYTQGRKARTRKALLKAYRRNKYPMRLLAGVEEYPEDPLYYQFGDKVEALQVLDMLLGCFEKDKKLIHWFLDTLLTSGEWEDEDEREFEWRPNIGASDGGPFPLMESSNN